MPFRTLPPGSAPPPGHRSETILVTDDWNDWFEYQTQYRLWHCDDRGELHEIGNVKIGQIGMRDGQIRPEVPATFADLDDSYFSVGQDDTYYENLNRLGSAVRSQILSGLRDMAFDEEAFAIGVGQRVTIKSLFRDVATRSVVNQFRRIAHGGARLTPFEFTYFSPSEHQLYLRFEVAPDSKPPTNVHVLIGRNGVGKTHLMNAMANALVHREESDRRFGYFHMGGEDDSSFINLVFVSFSAFDLFRPLTASGGPNLQYTYVGLQGRASADTSEPKPKSPADLRQEFVEGVSRSAKEPTRSRWKSAVSLLECDPIFSDAEASSLFEAPSSGLPSLEIRAAALFDTLSSGHKIVLLTITRLVETIGERSLVLMDEPEAHLHPPLLAAFVRALSELLIDRNGVAIIATHSPVVLQEVPKTCVWKIRRSGYSAAADRPEIETFGENVGVLTREVFGLEVTQSGFHNVLRQLVDSGHSYHQIVNEFNGQLGDEARGLLQALVASRQAGL